MKTQKQFKITVKGYTYTQIADSKTEAKGIARTKFTNAKLREILVEAI